jgi:hypothetical protein
MWHRGQVPKKKGFGKVSDSMAWMDLVYLTDPVNLGNCVKKLSKAVFHKLFELGDIKNDDLWKCRKWYKEKMPKMEN